MDILATEEEVGSNVRRNWVTALMFNHTTATFKKLLHIIKVILIEVLLLKLVSNDQSWTLLRALHREGKLRGSGSILNGIKDFLERINKSTLPTVGSTIA